jgi:uncharacterized protein
MMTDRQRRAAIDGWYTLEGDQPHLLGSRCIACGTFFFPRLTTFCRNPVCEGSEFESVPLSRTGRLWSYTNASYQPPEPYVAAVPFVPFAIAAVALEHEKMTVLGQVVSGIGVEQLQVGMEMELVVETLHQTEAEDVLVWKWRPCAALTRSAS